MAADVPLFFIGDKLCTNCIRCCDGNTQLISLLFQERERKSYSQICNWFMQNVGEGIWVKTCYSPTKHQNSNQGDYERL